MTLIPRFADQIPGFIKVALMFDGRTPSGDSVSLAFMADGETETVVDLGKGFTAAAPGLTQAMKSYVSGMCEVSRALKARHIEDEPDVTEDDLEHAALTFAFPRLSRDPQALAILKAHLDALQAHGVVEQIGGGAPKSVITDATAVTEAAKPEADKPEDEVRLPEAKPAMVLGAANAVSPAPEAKTDAAMDTAPEQTDAEPDAETAEASDDTDDTAAEVTTSPAPAMRSVFGSNTARETQREDDDSEDETPTEVEIPSFVNGAGLRPGQAPAQFNPSRPKTPPRRPNFFAR